MIINLDLNKNEDFIFANFAKLNTQRVVKIALPFLSLHPLTAKLSSLGVGGYQLYTIFVDKPAKANQVSRWAQVALLVSSTVLGYLFPMHQLILSSGFFFANQLYHLIVADKNWEARGTTLLQVGQHLTYLGSFYYGTPAWMVV